MSNKGYFIDRNPEIRAAGIATEAPDRNVDACLKQYPIDEAAESVIRSKCNEHREVISWPLFKRTACVPQDTISECLESELSKSKFSLFKEKFAEDMYFKRADLGAIKSTGTLPNDVTNTSQTFGIKVSTKDALYSLIMPPRTADDVNRAHAVGHEKFIVSHNHYFPSEQINRKYNKHFKRKSTFGVTSGCDFRGVLVKSCMTSCELPIDIKKSQVDYLKLTEAPLGAKYVKYRYDVPDMVFGKRTAEAIDVKMLMSHLATAENYRPVCNSMSYLINVRHKLRGYKNFDLNDFITILRSQDKDNTNLIEFDIIFRILNSMHVRLDVDHMRTLISYFKLFVNEGYACEQVNYMEFCKLLNLQERLPNMGVLSTMPQTLAPMNTTYRAFCGDRERKPESEDTEETHIKPKNQVDDEREHAEDLIWPDSSTRLSLGPGDFKRPRSKEELCRVFNDIVTVDQFCNIWKQLQHTYKDQNNLFSVLQFRNLIPNY